MDSPEADRFLAALVPRLRMIRAVARTEHITQAAESLRMPQPTLSRALSRLQDELGLALVERTGRGVRLTRAGRLLLPHVERALEDLTRGVSEITGGEQGRVALTFLPTLGVEVVPALLRGFRVEHPGVRFSLTQEPWAQSLRRVSSGGADLALTSPLPAVPGLVSSVLHTQALRLVVPEQHRLASATAKVVPLAAAQEEFILLKEGRGVRHLTDRMGERAGFTPRVAFEADDIATARGLVGAGLGVSVLPARPEGPLPGTVELAIADGDTERPLGVVWPAEGSGGGYEPPAVRLFRDYVQRVGPRVIPDLTG
ncbi:LysR family transcriptional regulator [Nocardiopsis sp. HNM0947]|uniref:LysR family transcriptional regulator n=1 Tax=Nocardiopsis coralli TaxID=2772213 RepID=A0ABR9P6E9_9ACTN|nr:LysR family transcriptional regulator [Nocardiopsis coralli]MBE2999427.1 LysR family transcriptional regulator [Nocardiopsis coralli]